MAPGHQRPDELLARRGLQPVRVARAAAQVDRFAGRAGPQDRAGLLQRARLGGACHHQPVGLHIARRKRELGRDRQRLGLALPAPVGALRLYARPRIPALGLSDLKRVVAFLPRQFDRGAETQVARHRSVQLAGEPLYALRRRSRARLPGPDDRHAAAPRTVRQYRTCR